MGSGAGGIERRRFLAAGRHLDIAVHCRPVFETEQGGTRSGCIQDGTGRYISINDGASTGNGKQDLVGGRLREVRRGGAGQVHRRPVRGADPDGAIAVEGHGAAGHIHGGLCAAGTDAGGTVCYIAAVKHNIARVVDHGGVGAGCILRHDTGAACTDGDAAGIPPTGTRFNQQAGGVFTGEGDVAGVADFSAITGNKPGHRIQRGVECGFRDQQGAGPEARGPCCQRRIGQYAGNRRAQRVTVDIIVLAVNNPRHCAFGSHVDDGVRSDFALRTALDQHAGGVFTGQVEGHAAGIKGRHIAAGRVFTIGNNRG